MKKIYVLTAIFIFLICRVFAQQVPLGMQYQAVARDLQGKVLPSQEITLKINLVNDEKASKVLYSEVHTVTTNTLGLFTLVIGGGKAEKGNFADVPWSKENIWMQVAIKDKGKSDYAIISNSKLLAVPYAFHAGTANRLTNYAERSATNTSTTTTSLASAGTNATTTTSGVPSNSWLLFGNSSSDSTTAKLGTTDNAALRLYTNNVDRLHINANGNISIQRSLAIGANLNVDSSVNLNRTAGSTLNYGPFTVGTSTRRSPTVLAGTLSVDLATDLNSSLNVDGQTDLNSDLRVNNGSPTLLTGTLRVNKDAAFKKLVRVDTTLNSDTALKSNGRVIPNGALVVMGGVGIDSNLSVNGDARFGGHSTFGGAVAITDATPSTSTTTGALTVGGGVGIGKQLNVGGITKLNSTLEVIGATTLRDTLGVTGVARFNNTTGSTSSSTGALKVAGGAGIGENLNVAGTLTVAGATTLNNTLAANGQVTINSNVNDQDNYSGYPLQVQGSGQGIAVKVNGSRSSGNNFISFWDENGMQGRIEGQTLDELNDDADYLFERRQYVADITFGALDLALAGFDAFQTLTNTVAAATSATACLGLGACVTSPIPSLIASSAAEDVVAVAEVLATTAEIAFTSVNLADYDKSKQDNIGVTYQSGAGDYAEYLMKDNTSEQFIAGDIIGVKGGKISKNTGGAEKLMVISKKPIVLGNTPSAGNEKDYEKVAFLGQVPVKVFGSVNLGDYIVANGNNNGVGVAVAPNKLEAKDVKNIVGIAWSAASNPILLNTINVAVGLNVNDNQKLVDELQKQIVDLKSGISEISSQLEKLVPGFKASTANNVSLVANKDASSNTNSNTNSSSSSNPNSEFTVTPDDSNTHYYQLTKEDILKGAELAQQRMKDNGTDIENHPFWKKFNHEAGFKDETVNKILTKFNNEVKKAKGLNKKG